MRIAISTIALLCVSLSACAQIHKPTTGTAPIRTNGDLIISEGTSSTWGIITSTGTTTTPLGTCGGCFVTDAGNGAITWQVFNDHSVGPETRKDDGKGLTHAELLATAYHPASAPAHYLEVAREIGLDPSPITDEAALLQAITENGLHVFDYAKVDDYLYRQALKQSARTRWVWKPMRKKDSEALKGEMSQMFPNAGYVFNAQYAQRLPERILEEVKLLMNCAPDASFLVSDYEVVRPDPFLAVTTPQLLAAGKVFIIDQWDEPGFSDSTEVSLRASR